MKKLLLIFTAILMTGLTMNAQDLQLFFFNQQIADGDTIFQFGDAGAAEIVIDHLQVYNNTDKAMSVMVSRERLDMQPNASSQFCWGLCFSPATTVSPEPKLIQSEEFSTNEDFSGHYLPNGDLGNSYVKYNFYNETNQFNIISAVVRFLATPTGIAEEAMNGGRISEIYPNPASNVINLDYELTSKVNEASLKVFNLLGAEVKTANLERNSNKATLDVSDLNNGIYFYTVFINGDAFKTKKLVLQK